MALKLAREELDKACRGREMDTHVYFEKMMEAVAEGKYRSMMATVP